jgi:hypothetical protein
MMIVSYAAIWLSGQGASPVAVGTWGGPHASFVVTDAKARLELDCATVVTDRRLTADTRGGFHGEASMTLERGGSIDNETRPVSRRARLSGRVNGRAMALDVTALDPDESVGHFELELGKPAELRKCK